MHRQMPSRIFGRAETGVGGDSAKGRLIGWTSIDRLILLEPDSAFAVAHRLAQDQGASFPVRRAVAGPRRCFL